MVAGHPFVGRGVVISLIIYGLGINLCCIFYLILFLGFCVTGVVTVFFHSVLHTRKRVMETQL